MQARNTRIIFAIESLIQKRTIIMLQNLNCISTSLLQNGHNNSLQSDLESPIQLYPELKRVQTGTCTGCFLYRLVLIRGVWMISANNRNPL